MTRRSRTYAVIAGGGTGGHVTPALAIAQALIGRGHRPESLHFIGSRRGLETRLVPDAGFALTALPGRGIERKVSLAALGAVVALVLGVVKGVAAMVRLRPAVLVTVGGYASVPAVIGAVLTRTPIVIAEQNAVPGAANRLAARFAAASAVTFPGTPLPRAVVTGNPVRSEVLAVDRTSGRDQARRDLGLPLDRFVVLVTTGSLGSRTVNDAVVAAAAILADRADIAIHHVVGRRDHADVTARRPQLPAGGLHYQTVEYEDRMHLALAAADVAVTRAGASTAAELAVVGLAAVMVPLPGAPGDHQRHNAEAMVEAGGARMVLDADLDGGRLAAEIEQLAADPELVTRMGQAAATLGRRDAADRAAELVEEHARAGRVAGEEGS